jgi:hypothetical protein
LFFPFFIAAVNTQSIVLPVIAPFVVVTDFVLSFVFFSLFAAVPFFWLWGRLSYEVSLSFVFEIELSKRRRRKKWIVKKSTFEWYFRKKNLILYAPADPVLGPSSCSCGDDTEVWISQHKKR